MHEGTTFCLALCKVVPKCPNFLIITHILEKNHAQTPYSEGLIEIQWLLIMAVSCQEILSSPWT